MFEISRNTRINLSLSSGAQETVFVLNSSAEPFDMYVHLCRTWADPHSSPKLVVFVRITWPRFVLENQPISARPREKASFRPFGEWRMRFHVLPHSSSIFDTLEA